MKNFRRHESQNYHIPEVTKQELQTAIDCLKIGKTGDTIRMKAVDLRDCDDETKENMEDIFNEITEQEFMIPKSWTQVVVRVIYKKDDAARLEK